MSSDNRTPELVELEEKFFLLLINLLESEGYSGVERVKPISRETSNLQLLAHDTEGKSYAIGVRTYRSPSIPTMSANFALRNLDTLIQRSSSKHGLLIITAYLPSVFKESINFTDSHYKIWDLPVLREKFSRHLDMLPDFEAFINELQPFKEETTQNKEKPSSALVSSNATNIDEGSAVREELSELLKAAAKKTLDKMIASIGAVKGHDIADRLEDIKPGKEDDSDVEFENVLVEALQFLFKEDLTAFKTQQKTEALHRFDLIARISSQDEFWSTLQNHFRAKYVIFEFKNYTKKITQREIYSTEKYLYLPAMRSVAIIISREGPNVNAESAARGSLREQGKVILNLTLKDIADLLREKDNGGNPNDKMTTILDNMLMQIER